MMAHENFMFMRIRILTVILFLAATPAWSRVLLRWTQPSLPAPATMGVSDLVVSWDDAELIRNAHRQGYRVYAEVPLGKAADMARSMAKSDLAGIILNLGDSQPSQIDQELQQLRSAYPGLPVLVLNPKAKQPQMKGQMVIKREGVLQVTSPTAQPWVDTNLALVRLDQAFRPSQTPLYEFQWDLSDPQLQEVARLPRTMRWQWPRRERSAPISSSTSIRGCRQTWPRTNPLLWPSSTRSSAIWRLLREGKRTPANRMPTSA